MAEILKRNNQKVPYDSSKIIVAIEKAMCDVGTVQSDIAEKIANEIEKKINETNVLWNVERISDNVEYLLMDNKLFDVAKAYILYREGRSKEREIENPIKYKVLNKSFVNKYKHLNSPMSQLGNFVYYRTYSRWLAELGRREYWWETVARSVDYNCSLVPTTKEEAQQLYDNMFNLRQFLSGRSMWVGNTSVAEQFPMANYNCSFEVIEDIESFGDLFYLLMLGCGVGIRISKNDVKKLPPFRNTYTLVHEEFTPIPKDMREDNTSLIFDGQVASIIIGDSKNGWVDALRYYFMLITDIQYKNISTIIMNYDNVRPAGEKLKTFGGTASGHEALKDVFSKIRNVLKHKASFGGKFKLKPIDCLDICNIIGEGVVVGGKLSKCLRLK